MKQYLIEHYDKANKRKVYYIGCHNEYKTIIVELDETSGQASQKIVKVGDE